MANSNLRDDHKYRYISTNTETVVDTGPGRFIGIILGETAAGAITIADAASGATPVIGVLKASIVEGTYIFNVQYTTGLVVTTAGASKLTVVYEPSN